MNTTNVQNVVQVDFIDAEYMGNGLSGFNKKMPKGYNGGKATGKKGAGGNGGDGAGGGDGGPSGNGKNGGKGDGSGVPDGPKPGSHLTDEQIRKIMEEDPEAAKFLDGILPDQ